MNTITVLKQLIDTPQNCIIIPHKNPDGDALGSTLALYHFLNQQEIHTCSLISPNEYPEFLNWLPGQEQIILFSKNEEKVAELISKATLIFTLDFNSLKRIEPLDKIVEKSTAKKIMIDHHQAPDDYAHLTFSDTNAISTCEILYTILEELNFSLINKEIAQCLYTGIMTDSGSFRYPRTSSTTHSITSKLLDFNIEHSKIHENIYDDYSFDRLNLLSITLSNLVKMDNLPVTYITLSQDELNKCNFKKGDTEGFVNYGLSLKNTKLAVIMIENKQEQIIKMSFRSKGSFDVNLFAKKYFNGGGHQNAAGGISKLSLQETVNLFEENIRRYQNEFN